MAGLTFTPYASSRGMPDFGLVPTQTVTETWEEIVDACGLTLDDNFSVYELSDRFRGHPAGSLVVDSAEGTIYVQNPPATEGWALVERGAVLPATSALASQCARCPALAAGRSCIVEGTGPFQPLLMVIGEAPGREEDEAGSPFVGSSGKLLRASLAEFGLDRSKVFFTNAIRCRPPENRDPHQDELDNCRDWLRQEIEQVQPQHILCVGKTAEAQLRLTYVPLSTKDEYDQPILYWQTGYGVVRHWQVYHPAYILRAPRQRDAWLKQLREIANACLGQSADRPGAVRGADAAPATWDEGRPDYSSPWLAVDTEYDDDDGSGEGGTKLVSVQCSDGRTAEFYGPLHDLAGAPGQVGLRADQLEGADPGGASADPGTQVRTPDPAGDGRQPSLPSGELLQPAPSARRVTLGELIAQPPVIVATVGDAERESLLKTIDLRPGARNIFGPGDHVEVIPARLPHVWCHNIKADARHIGLDLSALDAWDDTALIAYVLRYERVGLKVIGPDLTGLDYGKTLKQLLSVEVTKTRRRGNVYYLPHNKGHEDVPYKAKMMYQRVPYQQWFATEQLAWDYLNGVCDELKLSTEVITSRHREPIQFSEALEKNTVETRNYAMLDAVITSRLAEVLWPKLQAEPKLLNYYQTFEKPTVPVLERLERVGALVDADQLTRLGEQLDENIALHRLAAATRLGCAEEAISSNRQLADALLRNHFALRHKTPTGQWQVDRAVLLELAGVASEDQLGPQTPAAIYDILQFRQLAKLKSTYVDALLRARDSHGRVHGRFNQMVTDTNRLSSSDPNLQNIPARTALGREIRKSFIARPGRVLVKADFSQLEVRIYAHYTGEAALVKAYTATPELDVHQSVADELLIPRKRAKNVLFGAIYGADAPKLAETAGVIGSEARAFLTRLQDRLPSLLTWQDRIGRELTSKGYVETLFGWRNYYPLYWSPVRKESREALRQAANMPIQGTAGGILKLLFQVMQPDVERYDAELVLTVHDEVVFEVPESAAGVFARRLEDLGGDVTDWAGLSVPLRLEVEIGRNWAETHPWREWTTGNPSE